MTLTHRLATAADAPAIAAIYNQGIADRIATFETEPRTEGAIRELLVKRGDRFPTVVVEQEGSVVAFAWASEYRSRPCYAGIAEHGIYVNRSARGQGVGKLALTTLCAEYASLGFWKLLSRIFPENVGSLRLHEQCGFRLVGTYQRHAQLDGVWMDCVIVEKLLT